MARIKEIIENVDGVETKMYPVTSTKAVYNENNEKLDDVLKKVVTDSNYEVTTDRIVDGAVTEQKLSEEVNTYIQELKDNVYGVDNREIIQNFKWNRRRWLTGASQPNGVILGYNDVQKLWSTDKLDVSTYDTIVISGLSSLGNVSTWNDRLSQFILYGDDNLIYEKMEAGTYTIYKSDYPQYSKFELIIQHKSQSDDEFIAVGTPSIIVSKKGVAKEVEIPKRVVIVGDSICGNTSARIVKQFNNILKNMGYENIISHCWGGENIIGNLTRAGGMGIRVKKEFIIPSSASSYAYCSLGSAWIKTDGNYSDTPYLGMVGVQVVINGIRGWLDTSQTNAVGIAFYSSDDTFISSLSDSGTFDIPTEATKYVFTVNNPYIGEPHITINGDAVENIDTLATRSGYIDNTGTFVSNEGFKCSEMLTLNQGTIYIDGLASSTEYRFLRLQDGVETKIGVGSIFFDASLYDDKNYPHIWFTGQNGGYETNEEWAKMVKSAAENFSDKYIVCSTALERTNEQLIYYANREFGARYLNLRAYTQGQAVYDGQHLGIIDSQYTASDYETLFWPGTDKVHQSEKLSYIWAVKMWNTLLELGYVKGDRIDTGDYYVE